LSCIVGIGCKYAINIGSCISNTHPHWTLPTTETQYKHPQNPLYYCLPM